MRRLGSVLLALVLLSVSTACGGTPAAETVTYNTVVSGFTDLTGSGAAITTSGQKYLTVAEVDSSDRARAVGVVKLS